MFHMYFFFPSVICYHESLMFDILSCQKSSLHFLQWYESSEVFFSFREKAFSFVFVEHLVQ